MRPTKSSGPRQSLKVLQSGVLLERKLMELNPQGPKCQMECHRSGLTFVERVVREGLAGRATTPRREKKPRVVGKNKRVVRTEQRSASWSISGKKGDRCKGCVDVGTWDLLLRRKRVACAEQGLHTYLAEHDSYLSYTAREGSLEEHQFSRGCLEGKQAFSVTNRLFGGE